MLQLYYIATETDTYNCINLYRTCRDGKGHTCSLSNHRIKFKSPPEHFDAVTNQIQSEAVPLLQYFRIKTFSIVVNINFDGIITYVHQNFQHACLAMARSIPKQFLQSAKDHYLDIRLHTTLLP